jgi:predicted nucleic-acid-binding protein
VIGLDTNVLVRLLVRDDESQFKRARDLVSEAAKSGRRLYVSEIALCELVRVLSVSYGLGRAEITSALERVLEAQEVFFDDAQRLGEAIRRYARGRGDFADHLIALQGRSAGCEATATFDRKLHREPGFVAA